MRRDWLPWLSVVKSPPAQEAPTGSAREPLLVKPTRSGACALRQEKPALQVEQACTRQRRPSAVKTVNRCS